MEQDLSCAMASEDLLSLGPVVPSWESTCFRQHWMTWYGVDTNKACFRNFPRHPNGSVSKGTGCQAW